MINKADLENMEHNIAMTEDCYLKHAAFRLLNEVRTLSHSLEDPNYIYATGRVTRLALVIRDAENGQLRDKIKELETRLTTANVAPKD